MNGKTITVKSSSGAAVSAYVSLPPQGSGPGVVMISEIFGVNASVRKNADLFAGHGYVVLAPDVFWHQEPNLDLAYDKPSHEKALALHRAFDYERCVGDVADAVKGLRALSACRGAVFVTGFCLGGTMSYLAAARLKIDGAASYYGTKIHDFLSDASKVSCPLLLHFGETDHLTPPAAINAVRQATRGNPNVTSFIYEGAGHQFANPDRPEHYVPTATRLAHQRTFELFDRVAAGKGPTS